MKKLLALLCACVMVCTNAWADNHCNTPAAPIVVDVLWTPNYGGEYDIWIDQPLLCEHGEVFTSRCMYEVRRMPDDVLVSGGWADSYEGKYQGSNETYNNQFIYFIYDAIPQRDTEFWYEIVAFNQNNPSARSSVVETVHVNSGAGGGGEEEPTSDCLIPGATSIVSLGTQYPSGAQEIFFAPVKTCVHGNPMNSRDWYENAMVYITRMPDNVCVHEGYVSECGDKGGSIFSATISSIKGVYTGYHYFEVKFYIPADPEETEHSFGPATNSSTKIYPVTLGANGWSTYSCNTDFLAPDANENIAAYSCSLDAENSRVVLNEIAPGTRISCGDAIILKGTEGAVWTPTCLNVQTNNSIVNNDLIGVTTKTTSFATGANYVLAKNNNTGDVEFVQMAAGKLVAQMRGKAYLNVPAANARALAIDFGGVVTGIKTLDAEQAEAAQISYDLFGRKVNAAKAGLRVNNGRVVMVK